jgi:hypothetical protein
LMEGRFFFAVWFWSGWRSSSSSGWLQNMTTVRVVWFETHFWLSVIWKFCFEFWESLPHPCCPHEFLNFSYISVYSNCFIVFVTLCGSLVRQCKDGGDGGGSCLLLLLQPVKLPLDTELVVFSGFWRAWSEGYRLCWWPVWILWLILGYMKWECMWQIPVAAMGVLSACIHEQIFDGCKSGWLARIWFTFFLLNIFSVLWILETSSVFLNSWVWKVHVSSSRRTTTMPLCATLSLWKHLRVDWVLSAAIFRTWRILFIFSWCPSTVLTFLSYVSKSLLFCWKNN